MQLRTLFATLAITTALSITPVHAQVVDPCTVYLCMTGISGNGLSGGPGCTAATTVFFNIAIYDESGFDAAATAAARTTYLETCNGAEVATNAALLTEVIKTWYSVP